MERLIHRLSSEYYYLMPRGDMEHVKLPVLDKDVAIKKEVNRVEYTLKLEVTERLLLGAQYRYRSLR